MLCVSWAPRFFGTVGEKRGFALYSSFPTCFFPSWLFWGEIVVFPHGEEAGEEAGSVPCCPPLPAPCGSSFVAPLLGGPQGCFPLLSPLTALLLLLFLLAAGLCVLSRHGQGSHQRPRSLPGS